MATFIYYFGAVSFCTASASLLMAIITYLDQGGRK